jgi:ferric-dicitrate binding protein FerR (iron transport regulator)
MKANESERHLTSQEISQWLVEGPSAGAEAHADNCYACQAKLAEARQPLEMFRTAVMAWSEAQPEHPVRMVQQSQGSGRRAWIWAPALSLALGVALLAGFLVSPRAVRNHATATPAVANAPVSDAVLMEQVDSEVSEAVPDAMAPLTDLVAWDSPESAAAGAKKPVKGKTAATAKVKAKQ